METSIKKSISKSSKFNSNMIIKDVYKKYKSDLCDDSMTFHDCELEILRHAVDESDEIRGAKIVNNEEVKRMLKIVEDFLIRKKLVCYGGTAINNILPKFAQFYKRDIEVPDYDFYSPNALEDAKELADISYKEGYTDVEAKSGVHMGTFKVFVNYIPLADITNLNKMLFESILKDSVIVSGIRYAPADFLRMAMYLELSRPAGDVSRWEKVLKRLNLLNKHHPLKTKANCSMIDFQRKREKNSERLEKIYLVTRDSFIDQGVVFFGGYATSLYSKYMPSEQKHIVKKIPDFDVLSEEPEKCAVILRETLEREGIKKIKCIDHEAIGEIIPMHVEVRIENMTIAYIYKPVACHNYNKITIDNKDINVATIDTILAFYLAFLYVSDKYYNKDRLLCMAKYLFEVENKNRLAQTGLLKRFSLNCIGKQPTLEDIRSEKAEKFKELATKRGTKEYEMWFLKYVPADNDNKKDTEPIKNGIIKKIKNKRKQPKTRKLSLLGLLQKKQKQNTQKNNNYFYE
jgi:hypothetical protein